MKRLLNWLEDEGGLKNFIKRAFYCRKDHDWRNAGDWMICGRCDKLSKITRKD